MATGSRVSGTIIKVKDGDTYLIKSGDTIYDIRLHFADCPEIAHNSKEVSQPYGPEAAKYVNKFLNDKVTFTVKGKSYFRIVADVHDDINNIDLATDLVSHGLAELDLRYRPPASLIQAQNAAKEKHLGLWSLPQIIHPWDWRNDGKAKQSSENK